MIKFAFYIMDSLNRQVTELTGSINALVEQLRGVERRIQALENVRREVVVETEDVIPQPKLKSPENEEDIKAISRLPDTVKELQVFEGNPVQYISWVHAVENILKDFEIIREKPLYRAILQHIRQKIRGSANAALISYNIFDDDWDSIKRILSLHYADKRDIRTLEHQMNQLSQKGSKLDEFYAAVNHQFSLIINKIRSENHSEETISALVDTYRNRALDVFVRGLNGDLSRMLIIQRPKTLPEAYTSCLELQNLSCRTNSLHPASQNTIVTPTNQIKTGYRREQRPQLPPRRFFNNYGNRNNYSSYSNAPPRPNGPKPHERMEVDQSSLSRKVNYMNRPYNPNYPIKREAPSENYQRKEQKMFHVSLDESPEEEEYNEYRLQNANVEEETSQTDFMEGASLPAYHT